MDLQYVHEFVTLVETGNYMKAADSMFMAQSALSRHIQSLEKELGVSLITRSTRHIELSEYGKLFFPYAQELIQVEYRFNTELYNRMNNVGGTLIVGSLPVMAPYHIPGMLTKFRQENRNITIQMTQSDDIEQLRNGTADFIFYRETGKVYPDITMMPFNKDRVAAVLPVDHPLAGRESLPLELLRDEKFLLLPKNNDMYRMCVDSCRRSGFEPNVIYSGPDADNIVMMVQDHMGVGLLTRKPLEYRHYSGISIVNIAPEIPTTISLAYLKNKRLSVAAAHFINCVKAFSESEPDMQ